MCLAYQKRELPANLHYKDPHDLDEVHDGRIQIVTKNTPFRRGYAALNSFSYTGANVHILLKGHYKEKVSANSYSFQVICLPFSNSKLWTRIYLFADLFSVEHG